MVIMVNNINYDKIYKTEAIRRFPELYDQKYDIKNISVYKAESLVNMKMQKENINLSNLKKYLVKEVTNNILYEPTNNITSSILNNYNELSSAVSRYSFSSKSEKLGKQNENNQRILIMLSLLKPNILKMLSDIDYCINHKEVTEASILMIRLTELDDYLRFVREELEISEYRYHKIWNNIFSNTRYMIFTKRDLGIARREWSKWKSNAVSDMVNTYLKLLNLDQMVIEKVYHREEAMKKINKYRNYYQEWIDNIKQEDNYYSYIDQVTKKKEIRENTLKKKHAM